MRARFLEVHTHARVSADWEPGWRSEKGGQTTRGEERTRRQTDGRTGRQGVLKAKVQERDRHGQADKQTIIVDVAGVVAHIGSQMVM